MNKYKYRDPRRVMPGQPLPDVGTQAVDRNVFRLQREREFLGGLRFFLSDVANDVSGMFGVHIDQTSATDGTPFGISFDVAEAPLVELYATSAAFTLKTALPVTFTVASLGVSGGTTLSALTVTGSTSLAAVTSSGTAGLTNLTVSGTCGLASFTSSGTAALTTLTVSGTSNLTGALTAGVVAAANYAEAVATKTANYPITAADGTIRGDATAGAITITLPTAAGIAGRTHTIKKIDASANAVTVATTGGQTIDGAATLALPAQYNVTRVRSNGTNWDVV